MLQKFSWSEYWGVVLVGVAIYYGIVLLLLYRSGLLSKSSFKKPAFLKARTQQPTSAPIPETQVKSVAPLSNQSDVENAMKSLTDEVLNFLQDIAGKSYVKEEIIMGLQIILREYQEFAGTVYQSDISEFLRIETENHCSVDLSEDEIKRVWMG